MNLYLGVRKAAAGPETLNPTWRSVVLIMRLRLPVAPADTACQLCDGVADRYGDHSRACPCGGDRVKRHNRLRSVLASRAQAAGLSVAVEKPGLLPLRPDEDGTDTGARGAGSRCQRLGGPVGLARAGRFRSGSHLRPPCWRPAGSLRSLRLCCRRPANALTCTQNSFAHPKACSSSPSSLKRAVAAGDPLPPPLGACLAASWPRAQATHPRPRATDCFKASPSHCSVRRESGSPPPASRRW